MRRLLLRSLIILAITLGLLAAAEASVRLYLRLRTGACPETAASPARRQQAEVLKLYRLHPFLNTAPHGGRRVRAFGKEAGFNALGYRSPERPRERPPGVLRVLCAGGSTTFHLLAASDEE